MKAAPSSIPIPENLARRPRWHGLPIPFIATIKPDGEPDFRVTDEVRRQFTMAAKVCQLCGHELGRDLYFFGGRKCAASLAYFEPAMHLECLIYAAQVCPFIAGQRGHDEIAAVKADNPDLKFAHDPTLSNWEKDELWVIVKARHQRFIQTPGGTLLIKPKPPVFLSKPLRATEMGPEDWAKISAMMQSALLIHAD